jgi:hypothetical protein
MLRPGCPDGRLLELQDDAQPEAFGAHRPDHIALIACQQQDAGIVALDR